MILSGLKDPNEDLTWVAPQPPLSKTERLNIYHTSWWLRLFESIADDYEALARCVGRPRFRTLIRAYLKEYPPHSYTLVHAGNSLPEFLMQSMLSKRGKLGPLQRQDAERSGLPWAGTQGESQNLFPWLALSPWLIDLAQLERALYQAYHAKDSPTWDPQWLSQLKPEMANTLRLRLQPSVTLLKSRWKVTELLKKGKSCRHGASHIVVYRHHFRSTHQELNPLQYKLLQLTQENATLGQWAECGGSSSQWVTWLGHWAEQGIIFPEGQISTS